MDKRTKQKRLPFYLSPDLWLIAVALFIAAALAYTFDNSVKQADDRINNIIDNHQRQMKHTDKIAADSVLVKSYERELLLDSIKAERKAHPESWDANENRLLDKIDSLMRVQEANYREYVRWIIKDNE